MNKRLICLATGLYLAGTLQAALACTTIIVGKGASVDGSLIIARNEDTSNAVDPQLIMRHDPSTEDYVFRSNSFGNPANNQFSWQMPAGTLGYVAFPEWESVQAGNPSFEEVGFNDRGVALSATETIFNSDAVLAVDPYLVETGIGEDGITTVVLPQAASARHGVLLLGYIIEHVGAGEGFGVAFTDAHEAWYLETVSGHHWVAQRIPDDAYFVSANQGRFQQVNLSDPLNVMASAGLAVFLIEQGLYDPSQGPLDLFACCIANGTHDQTYNYPRVERLLSLYSGLDETGKDGRFSLFPTPSEKLSIADVARGLRDYYQGTTHDPYTHQNPQEPWRPISVLRASLSHITQTRSELPVAIGRVNYIALGMTALSAYVPIYWGLSELPAEYQHASDQADDESLFWRYRKLQTLVFQDYPRFAPKVQQAIHAFEQENAREQRQMEQAYLASYQQEPAFAKSLIQKFTGAMLTRQRVMLDQLTTTLARQLDMQDLRNDDYTRMIHEIETSYHFHGA
ncbi:Dipeptidase [Thiorhodovibrio winogradskyi]|uniref:Dipeptidase n=1 Tax=Thiorhodovibrio winogradskyi TaxID=77007 RepID=A0ABZ0SJD8_9GAMM|nr:C69 family dipeptidase [Thiorhodovibrio winogradskyi]